jgi:hypothetical protein
MKTKIFIVFILVAFACLPLKALAYERNFPAGSIIIPMDTFYQPEADGGLLEAYGLAYYLLDHQDPDCLTDAPTDPVTIACQDTCPDGDSDCELACLEDVEDECEHTISISWVINDQKTDIGGVDLRIDVTAETLTAMGISAVVKEYDHAGGTTDLTFNPNEDPVDSAQGITYHGSIFIIDVQDLEEGVEDEVYALINSSSWAAVNVHVALVPFAAPVFRDMRGTPPKIALMNDGEDKTSGNAAILESYLRLAGICTDSYEIVTPNEIAGFAAGSCTPINPVLGPNGPGYDFLWAPHWDATKNYDGTSGCVSDYASQNDIVEQIQLYLKSGKGMLAECASIETFEHNSNGHFLTDKGFGHNMGTDDAADIIYLNVATANAQIGDTDVGFDPDGGHLHNWRPYQSGDDYNLDPLPDVSGGASVYNNTVKRFTIDNTGWDYFVGGYAYGNNDFGYVVYLGGHSYADCDDVVADDLVVDPEPNAHPLELEFSAEVYDADFTLQVDYKIVYGGNTVNFLTAAVPFASDDLTAKVGGWDGVGELQPPLQIDFTTVTVDSKGKKFYDIILKNTFPVIPLEIQKITLAWDDGNMNIKKLIDNKTDVKHYDTKEGAASIFNLILNPGDFVIDEIPPGVAGGDVASVGCTNNSGCSFKNLAAVRYVLNTLFNIKYQVVSHEYVRSAPIVAHPWLYQGSFEHPSYFGHFRRFDVEEEDPTADWDTAAAGRILNANTGNLSGRKVYTAAYDDVADDWSKINFDAANVDALTAGLDVEDNSDTADEIKVIERLRGRDWDYDEGNYVEQEHNKLGGIMHSSPVIIRSDEKDSRFSSTNRPEVAYVGDLYGMLHAIETATGIEKWAYIPSNLLDKLKNDRTDPNADPHFAAVDASPTAKDIYYDHDSNSSTPDEWRTILVCAQGFGGNSIFALDVTDPANWEVLWEATDNPLLPDELTGVAPGGGMGYSFRAALDKVKVPVYQNNDPDSYPTPVGYEVKWMVYVATSFAHIAEDHGGINVFAFDLQTGTEQWTFSSTYADSVNDIPGAVTTFDIDEDTLADRIYVGDMNGRMWEIALTDDPSENLTAGQSVHTYEYPDPADETQTLTKEIPLFDAGIGNPISVSPAIISRNGHVLLIFGTGGADWASDAKGYYVYAVDATEAANLIKTDKQANYENFGGAIEAKWSLPLAVGEKVWSSPTVAAGQIWIVTSFGSMESTDPKSDKGGSSNLRLLNLDTGENIWDEPLTIGKVRGSIYVSREHVYMTTFEGEIIQIGDQNDFTSGTGNRVVLKSWQDR